MNRIVDLSHPISCGMPVYPGDAEVEVSRIVEWESGGYNLTTVAMSAHAGTHLDAPFHFVGDGITIDQIPLDTLIGWAEVLDLGELPPDAEITPTMLEPFSDRVKEGSRVLLRTGWSKRFHEPDFFTSHPNLTCEAAEWLVSRRIALLGVEQPSVHTKQNKAVHELILGAGIALIENLANLDQLTQDKVFLAALPLNLAGCDGAPVRAIALPWDIFKGS